MMDYGLGRLAAPDPRDHNHLMTLVAAPTAALPDSMTFRTGPALDQGQTPQCVGYSWRGYQEAAPYQTKRGPTAPAIYHGAQMNDEWDGENYDGSSVRGGAKYLKSIGRLASYLWAFNLADVEAWVLGGHGPVVLGTVWRSGMFDPDKDGRLRLTGQTVGGHAYMLYGMNRKKGIARIQNSWSSAWGVRGRAYLAYEDLERLLNEDGEACTAIEQRQP